MPEIGLFDAIYSARALRQLKPDPVPEEIIARILDAAFDGAGVEVGRRCMGGRLDGGTQLSARAHVAACLAANMRV